MSTAEKIAKDACDYLFRVGKHSGAKVEFDPVGYLQARIDEAAKTERERCAAIVRAYARLGKIDPSAAETLHGAIITPTT